jgi:hypothetical protein
MAVRVVHAKVSAVPNIGDASLVQPSDWNADHTVTGAEPAIATGNAAMFWAGDKTWKPSFVQLTQAAYDALGTKDPNTLYVVVG